MDTKSSAFVDTIEERYPDLGDDALQRVRAAGLTVDVAEVMQHLGQPGAWLLSAAAVVGRFAAFIDGLVDIPPPGRDALHSGMRQLVGQVAVLPQSLAEALENMVAAIDGLNLPPRDRDAIRSDLFGTMADEQWWLEILEEIERSDREFNELMREPDWSMEL